MAKKGLVFITKSTFSGSSAVSVDNCFSATYTHYLVKRNLLGSLGVVDVNVRLRASGVDATGANYRYQYMTINGTGSSNIRATGQTTWVDAGGGTESITMGFMDLWISNPFESVVTTAWTDYGASQTGNIVLASFVYAHDLTSSYTGFTYYPTSGTITGSISVFGLVTA